MSIKKIQNTKYTVNTENWLFFLNSPTLYVKLTIYFTLELKLIYILVIRLLFVIEKKISFFD